VQKGRLKNYAKNSFPRFSVISYTLITAVKANYTQRGEDAKYVLRSERNEAANATYKKSLFLNSDPLTLGIV
jgi:hypothetical protein